MDDFVQKLKDLSKKHETEKLIALLEEKVQQEPNNIEWLMRLAIVVQHPPLVDTDKSLELLERVLKLDPNNITAILIMAYIYDGCPWLENKVPLEKITSIQTDNYEEKSMLAYAASWLYQRQNDTAHEKQQLLESIKFCNKHVLNHMRLAQIYTDEHKETEAKTHLKQAMNNITKVYSDDLGNYDETDIDEFVNESIKGIHRTKLSFQTLQKQVEQTK